MRAIELSPTLIIGSGLVGASVGCALTAAGIAVHVTDLVPAHVAVAASRGAGTTDPVAPGDVRLVVVAVPPDRLSDVVASALKTYPHATVTDVGSVKGTVINDLRARRASGLKRYCGGHPMAGSHLAGPVAARADLFVDRTWVVAPHDTAAAATVLDVQELARLCGARIVTLGPAHHDEAVAQVSHLPHLMSALTGGVLNEVPASHLKLAGQGLRDVTRISTGDPGLWRQIISANADAVREQLVEVQAALGRLIDILDDPDRTDADLEDFLEWGRQGTRLIPGKHGTPAREFAQVTIEIPDAPGALARLFADIGEAGFNVEDVSIEHDAEREVGWLAVQVTEAKASELEQTMEAAGWTVRH
ncbi:prephenate dehydrogenase [Propioniciclava tarda]|uniref:Prephenate dehydrogenase n=1 Tax=Propioniciclava tarda TaxID=433330 RepID=A0A4Q9KMX5_PROTD|nr:prephenate dehydrogenase [Propioniciclava tarda]TBT95902.1 prephenate dehydrogenase [Propioniciclava tarda]SMO41309.1 prephenate dehydrogenase [Propioniciclava tarda]